MSIKSAEVKVQKHNIWDCIPPARVETLLQHKFFVVSLVL